MLTRFPTHLPRLLAALAGLCFLAFAVAGMQAVQGIGRPSSTASLGYVFAPIVAAAFAAGGYIVGFALRALLLRLGVRERSAAGYRVVPVAILIAGPVLAGMQGASRAVSRVRQREASARPRVLVSTPSVAWQADAAWVPDDARRGVRRGVLVWAADESWLDTAGRHLPASAGDGRGGAWFTLDGRRSAALNVSALDNVRGVYVLPLGEERAPRAYVAVLNGRATGRRSLVVVLAPDMRVLHAELVERWWRGPDVPLCADSAASPTAPDAAIIGGCDTDSPGRGRRLQLHEAPNDAS
jgi:hypothetical protein